MYYWYFIPALTAVISGGCIFAFCRNFRRFHKYMGFTLIFEGLFLMLSGMIFTGTGPFYLPTYLLYSLMMLLSPLFYYFAVRFSLKEKGVKKEDLWLLEAVGIYVLLYLAVVSCVPVGDRNFFADLMRGINTAGRDTATGVAVMVALDNVGYAFFLLEQLFVQIFCFVSLSGYNRLLETYYSNLSEKSSGGLEVIFVLVAVRFLIYIVTLFMPGLSSNGWFHILQTVAFCLFYGVIAWKVCSVRYTAEELAASIAAREVKSQAPVAGNIIGARLDKLVEEKFFLDPDIDLMTLSSKVQVNSKYVGEYIRRTYGETFLLFVNRLRVEFAIALMEDQKLSLQDISEKSGFVSISTFYRNFTKIKGVPPSKWKNK